MKGWRRRIRGALGMGLTWAAVWFTGGVALALAFPGGADVPFPVAWAALAFVAGVLFSGAVALGEGRRRFEELSLARFAGWGAVGGLVLCGLFIGVTVLAGESIPLENVELLAPIFAAAGAGTAASSLLLARGAGDDELLEPGWEE